MAFYKCGGGADTSGVTASASDVLVGKVIVNADGEEVVGTMPTFENHTSANATTKDILSGKTAWVNGKQITGNIKVNENPIAHDLPAGGCYDISAETFYRYGGKVRAKELAPQTQGSAVAGDILSGKTAWVNGQQVTGTLQRGSRKATGYLQLNGYVNSSGTYDFYKNAAISGLSFRPSFILIESIETLVISTKCATVLICKENYSSRVFYKKTYDMQEEQHSSKNVVRNSTGATITLEGDIYFLGGKDENGNTLGYKFTAYE